MPFGDAHDALITLLAEASCAPVQTELGDEAGVLRAFRLAAASRSAGPAGPPARERPRPRSLPGRARSTAGSDRPWGLTSLALGSVAGVAASAAIGVLGYSAAVGFAPWSSGPTVQAVLPSAHLPETSGPAAVSAAFPSQAPDRPGDRVAETGAGADSHAAPRSGPARGTRAVSSPLRPAAGVPGPQRVVAETAAAAPAAPDRPGSPDGAPVGSLEVGGREVGRDRTTRPTLASSPASAAPDGTTSWPAGTGTARSSAPSGQDVSARPEQLPGPAGQQASATQGPAAAGTHPRAADPVPPGASLGSSAAMTASSASAPGHSRSAQEVSGSLDAIRGLCASWGAHPLPRGSGSGSGSGSHGRSDRAHDEPDFGPLIQLAGGEREVPSLCASLTLHGA